MSIETLSFHVLHENQAIPMRDGVVLYGDLYLPAIDGVVEEGRKWSEQTHNICTLRYTHTDTHRQMRYSSTHNITNMQREKKSNSSSSSMNNHIKANKIRFQVQYIYLSHIFRIGANYLSNHSPFFSFLFIFAAVCYCMTF